MLDVMRNKLLISVILAMSVLVSPLVFPNIARAEEKPVVIKDVAIVQLHKDFNEIPHRYSFEAKTLWKGDFRYRWSVNCGYFVGEKNGEGEATTRETEWRYDKPGACANARMSLIITSNISGNKQMRVQNVFEPYNVGVSDYGFRESQVLKDIAEDDCRGYVEEYNKESKRHRGILAWLRELHLELLSKFRFFNYEAAVNERYNGRLFELWDRVVKCKEKFDQVKYDDLDLSPCEIKSPKRETEEVFFEQGWGCGAVKG